MYPRLLELGPLTVYTYGVLLAAAYLFGLKLAMVRAKSRNLDQTRILDLGIYIIISALVGAKLLLLVTDFRSFAENPRAIIDLARSGGVKCERCWRYVRSVSSDPAWAGLCERCQEALAETVNG